MRYRTFQLMGLLHASMRLHSVTLFPIVTRPMATRESLLDVTAKLYSELGWLGTTTRRIAEAAGVNEVTLFRQFGSKESLLLEAITLASGDHHIAARLPDTPRLLAAELTAWGISHHGSIKEKSGIIRACLAEWEQRPELAPKVCGGGLVAFADLTRYLGIARQREIHRPRRIDRGGGYHAHQCHFYGCHDSRCHAGHPSAFRRYVHRFVRRPGAARPRGEGARMKHLVLTVALALAASGPLVAQQQPVRLSLADALSRADSASPAVGIARAGIDGAQANVIRARASYLPQINGSATYSRALASEFSGLTSSSPADTFAAPTNCSHYVPDPSLPLADRLTAIEHGLDCAANGTGVIDFSKLPFGRPNTWTFGLSGSQTLFDRKIGGQVAAANAGRDQATIELDAQRAAAVLNVAQAYFDAQLAQRLVDIADSTFAQAQRTFDQTRLERQVGNAAEFDQLRAGVARDNQTPIVIQRRAQARSGAAPAPAGARHGAQCASCSPPPLADTTAVPLPAYVARVADDTAIAVRAPVREADAALRAAEGQLRSARAERTPSLTLSSTYSKIDFPVNAFSFDQFLTDWSVAVQLTVPIFNGGRMHGDALAAQAARDQAAMRVKQARQQAQLEQGDASTQIGSATAAFAASIGTVAKRSAPTISRNFATGTVSPR